MTRILHISDPHFGTEQAPVVAALEQLVRGLSPSHLVLSGDVTQRARPRQFAAARRFLERLAVPQTLVVPGNHDISLFNPFKRLFAPYAGFCRALGTGLAPVIDDHQVLIIGVNTTRRYRHVDGQVSAAQIRAVADRLQAAQPRQLRIVVTHQPAWVINAGERKNLLRGHENALRQWAQAGADLVLGGHIHLPYLAPIHQSLGGLARPLWVLQAGTAISARVRPEAGNSVNLLDYDGQPGQRRCIVSRWDYHASQQRFVMASEEQLALH